MHRRGRWVTAEDRLGLAVGGIASAVLDGEGAGDGDEIRGSGEQSGTRGGEGEGFDKVSEVCCYYAA